MYVHLQLRQVGCRGIDPGGRVLAGGQDQGEAIVVWPEEQGRLLHRRRRGRQAPEERGVHSDLSLGTRTVAKVARHARGGPPPWVQSIRRSAP